METLEHVLRTIISYGILLFEYAGVLVLVFDGIRGVIEYIKREPDMRLNLARGMATALSFKLGGEILRTVVVETFHEIAIVGCIILLRSALTFLIHWEIKHMEIEKESIGGGKPGEEKEPAPEPPEDTGTEKAG